MIIVTLNKFETQDFINLGIHRSDGDFIHACTIDQLDYVLNKHYKNESVYLFYLSENIENLKWEKAKNGDLFPHIYGNIQKKHVMKIRLIEDSNNNK